MNERHADESRANPPPRWRKITGENLRRAETFLREREKFCVAACARFLRMGTEKTRGHVWYLGGPDGEISALLINSRRSLFPLFDKNPRVPAPRFLNRFLGRVPVHSLQGLKEDVEILETLMEAQGYFPAERIDYELMGLDYVPRRESSGTRFAAANFAPASFAAARHTEARLPGLVIRPPLPEDTEPLAALQAAYEKEEVLPANAAFNPASSRLTLQHILAREYVLAAELDGRVVGKINTSAESFTRCQIGGVYVRPDCRGLGVGTEMTAACVRDLLGREKSLTLFVKKRNAAARAVYRATGFSVLADYRISYY